MPAPIAPLLGFVIGAAFAWAAADELARAGGRTVSTRSLAVVALFAVLVFAPVAGYFLAFMPDWAYLYLLDPRGLPDAVDLVLLLLDVVSPVLGFMAAARHASAHNLSGVLKMTAGPALGAIAILVASLPRLTVHATYAQYHESFGTRPVTGSPLGQALLWMLTILAIGVVWTLRTLWRIGSTARGD